MCGIIGIFGENLDRLASANKMLEHRGPDDFGIFIDSKARIGLGHRRLSIIDLSMLGHQPMHSEDGSVVIVFNGEIYNYKELRTKLVSKGVSFRGNSDTEVLVNLYLSEGESFISRLNGIFTFALWDSSKNSLLIARDSFGVKPLYYSNQAGQFAFASEIKALLHLIPAARDLDIAALHRYISFLWCPGKGTPLKNVKKLMPGEAMWVKNGIIERNWNWYKLPVFRGITADLDEKSALINSESLLRQAVQRQMVSDVPVGAFLSGGLDSSSIVSFAREINPNMQCFTIESLGGAEEGVTDDLPYARKVAKHLNVPLEVVSIDANRMAGDLEFMVKQLDEPLADLAPLNVFYISQMSSQLGIKVLLSGTGGDDFFTGYRRHRAIQAERYWRWMPRSIRRGLSTFSRNLNHKKAFNRRLSKLFSGADMEGDSRIIEYFKWIRESDLMSLYTNEARCSVGTELAGAPMLDFLKPFPKSTVGLDRMLALEQRFFLPDHNFTYTDKMSMAMGVEVRVPFLDNDLVDFSARIPLGLKQRGAEGKWVLKKMMEKYLPKDVVYRPKSGFGAPLRRWIRHDLRELLGDLLSTESLRRRGIFEPEAIHRLIKANDSGKVDASYTLLSLLCIEIWCRSYLN
ncbi:MAG: asparagine synthase (glutamine-hydrolyzing) [Planctomycetota bacterium]|nr:MAG: asparagine synthase (glutamine-hydrolyzing) [Planctomycetota bacterium]